MHALPRTAVRRDDLNGAGPGAPARRCFATRVVPRRRMPPARPPGCLLRGERQEAAGTAPGSQVVEAVVSWSSARRVAHLEICLGLGEVVGVGLIHGIVVGGVRYRLRCRASRHLVGPVLPCGSSSMLMPSMPSSTSPVHCTSSSTACSKARCTYSVSSSVCSSAFSPTMARITSLMNLVWASSSRLMKLMILPVPAMRFWRTRL